MAEIITILVLLPFIAMLEFLVYEMGKSKGEEEEMKYWIDYLRTYSRKKEG